MYFKVSFPTKVLKQLPENVPPKNIFLLEFTIFFQYFLKCLLHLLVNHPPNFSNCDYIRINFIFYEHYIYQP